MSDTAPQDPLAMFDAMAAAVAELPASWSIPLSPSVSFNNQEYTELSLREPTADEVRKAEEHLRAGPMLPHCRRNYQMNLIAMVSGLPLPVVQKIGVAKVQMAMAYLGLFLAAGQGTGVS